MLELATKIVEKPQPLITWKDRSLCWSGRILTISALAGVAAAQIYLSPPVAVMLVIVSLFGWVAVRQEYAKTAMKAGGLMLFYFAFWTGAWGYLHFIDITFPMKYDPQLLRVELIGITRACGWLFEQSFILRLCTWLVYVSLAYVMVAFYGWHLEHSSGKPGRVLSAFVVAFATGPLLYPLLPACGPAHAFPAGIPLTATGTMVLHGVPNCVPSLHMTTALLIVFYRLPGRFSSWATGLFALGTAWATLATGEHYVIDLVVAVPFTYFVRGVVERKVNYVCSGLYITLATMLLLRYV